MQRASVCAWMVSQPSGCPAARAMRRPQLRMRGRCEQRKPVPRLRQQVRRGQQRTRRGCCGAWPTSRPCRRSPRAWTQPPAVRPHAASAACMRLPRLVADPRPRSRGAALASLRRWRTPLRVPTGRQLRRSVSHSTSWAARDAEPAERPLHMAKLSLCGRTPDSSWEVVPQSLALPLAEQQRYSVRGSRLPMSAATWCTARSARHGAASGAHPQPQTAPEVLSQQQPEQAQLPSMLLLRPPPCA